MGSSPIGSALIMNEEQKEQNITFKDSLGREVVAGDCILYPVNTFLRLGVVKTVKENNWLVAAYIGFTYVLPQVRGPMNVEFSEKTQHVYKFHRSVVKVGPDEVQVFLRHSHSVDRADAFYRMLAKFKKEE